MDKQYLKEVLAGDANAFRYFVNKYQHMAFSISMSIVKSELLAEEVIQDAFVKAFQNIKKFKGKAKFSTWLYKIVVNESLRKIQRKRFDIVEIDNLPDDINLDLFSDTFNKLHELDQKEIIRETLLKMNSTESLLLRLYYLDENNIEEITEITNLSKSNVKVGLYRARKKFYNILKNSLKHEINSLL